MFSCCFFFQTESIEVSLNSSNLLDENDTSNCDSVAVVLTKDDDEDAYNVSDDENLIKNDEMDEHEENKAACTHALNTIISQIENESTTHLPQHLKQESSANTESTTTVGDDLQQENTTDKACQSLKRKKRTAQELLDDDSSSLMQQRPTKSANSDETYALFTSQSQQTSDNPLAEVKSSKVSTRSSRMSISNSSTCSNESSTTATFAGRTRNQSRVSDGAPQAKSSQPAESKPLNASLRVSARIRGTNTSIEQIHYVEPKLVAASQLQKRESTENSSNK